MTHNQGAYRTPKVVFHGFPGPFYACFPGLRDHLCPFSMSFQDCIIEWISNESDFHITLNTRNTVHNYTKQQIEPSPTVDNDNVCKGQKHVLGSEMQHPFGLFSITFQDLGLIP